MEKEHGSCSLTILVPSPMYIHVGELMQPTEHPCSASRLTCEAGVNHALGRGCLDAVQLFGTVSPATPRQDVVAFLPLSVL